MKSESSKTALGKSYSRREFIKTTAVAACTVSVLADHSRASTQGKDKPKRLPITMAGYNFDRTRALIDARVKIEGCDLQFTESGIGDR